MNLPETATVEEIEDIYLQSWKLGLKATAVYRDNCKVGQPLSDGKSESSKKDQGHGHGRQADRRRGRREGRRGAQALPQAPPEVARLADHEFTVGGAEGYMTSGAHDDGELGEIFLKLGKQGSTLAGVMDAFSIAVSIGLQYGVPLETYVSKFTNLRFEPSGMTDDPDVRMSQSIMDYIFRRLALDYLSFEDRSMLGIYSAEERQRHLETGSYEPLEETGGAEELMRRAGRRRTHPAVVEERAKRARQSRPRRRPRRPRRRPRDQGHPRRRSPRGPGQGRTQARPTPPPSSWRRSPAPPSTPRSA